MGVIELYFFHIATVIFLVLVHLGILFLLTNFEFIFYLTVFYFFSLEDVTFIRITYGHLTSPLGAFSGEDCE